MKKAIILLLIISIGTAWAQEKKMLISGTYTGSAPGEKLWIRHVIDGSKQQYAIIDSALVENGRFRFDLQGVQPRKYQVVNAKGKRFDIYPDYGESIVTIDTSFAKPVIKGNVTDSLVKKFDGGRFMYALLSLGYGTTKSRYAKEGQEVPDSISKVVPKVIDSVGKDNIRIAREIGERADLASAYIFSKGVTDMFTAAELTAIYKAMPEYVKKAPDGIAFKNELDKLLTLAEGARAPDFTETTPDGKKIALSDFIKGKKLVLIDFWASWCGPCRKENPNVVAVYNQYKQKGFDIISISLDDKKENWLKAISDDKLAWTHVSDLGGWQAKVAQQYRITAVPQTLLLNGEGKIIAKNLRGDALRQKVAEICN